MNRAKLGFILVMALVASGCWDVQEVDRRDFAVALGIDATSGASVRVSAQIAGPGGVLPPSSQAKAGDPKFFTVSSTARSIVQAIANLQAMTFRTIYLGQLKSVVFGETLARRGLERYLDFLTRTPNVPRSVNIYVAREPVGELLKRAPAEGLIPGLGLREQVQCIMKRDQAKPIELWRFLSTLDEPGEDPFAPMLRYDEANRAMVLSSEAVFRHDQLVGFLNPDQTRALAILQSHRGGGVLEVPGAGNATITLRSITGKSRVIPVGPNLNRFVVKVKANGLLNEDSMARSGLSSRSIKHLEALVAHRLQQLCHTTIAKLQEWEADPLGFGLEAQAHSPRQFDREKWRGVYSRAKVDVSVDFRIIRTGLYY